MTRGVISRCYCGALTLHSGEHFRVSCHDCFRTFAAPPSYYIDPDDVPAGAYGVVGEGESEDQGQDDADAARQEGSA